MNERIAVTYLFFKWAPFFVNKKMSRICAEKTALIAIIFYQKSCYTKRALITTIELKGQVSPRLWTESALFITIITNDSYFTQKRKYFSFSCSPIELMMTLSNWLNIRSTTIHYATIKEVLQKQVNITIFEFNTTVFTVNGIPDPLQLEALTIKMLAYSLSLLHIIHLKRILVLQ